MAHTISAKKRLRQNLNRRKYNRSVKHGVKTQMRKVHDALASSDLDKAEQEFRMASKKLDKAAARRILHRNTVARRKSQLASRIAAAKQSQT